MSNPGRHVSETWSATEQREMERLVRWALAEDVGRGDLTTRALVPRSAQSQARIVTRQPCVVCGVRCVLEVFRRLDRRVRVDPLVRDGDQVGAGTICVRIQGPARALLSGERTTLNFLQRLSGIATYTYAFVQRVRRYGTTILDTRKTTPGWRNLEKYAVRCGGGRNHRQGLWDAVLIKDNHRRYWSRNGTSRTLAEAVHAARRAYPGRTVEIEVDTFDELRDALNGRPDWVLLDNMSLPQLRRCVREVRGRARLEASGGVRLENVAAIAATGVHAISIGALTHSAPAVDFSMEFE